MNSLDTDTQKKSNMKNSTNDEVQAIALEEKSLAHGMCLKVNFKGVLLGEALVDQSCTRTLMRFSAFKKKNIKTKMMKVKNMSVMCSNGETVPIIGCFPETIYSENMLIGKTLVYVVANLLQAQL
jgi:hypothetical protein